VSAKHPPLPEIIDGEVGRRPLSISSNVHIQADVQIELGIQAEEGGSYRTSVITMRGADYPLCHLFAGRDQIERLRRLLGQHLEELDAYETALHQP